MAVQQGRPPESVSLGATKAAMALGLPSKEVKEVACVAASTAIAKHSQHVRRASLTGDTREGQQASLDC